MSTSARQLIDEAARISSVLASGETLSGNDINDAFKALVRLFDRWHIEGLLQNSLKKDPTSVASGDTLFTILQEHPIISQITYKQVGSNIELPLRVLTFDEWALISTKTLSGLPSSVYLNTNDDSTVSCYIWPIPNVNITVNVWRSYGITTPAYIDDAVNIPLSVIDALVFDLACMLCIQYSRPISQDLRDERDRAKASVMRSNIKSVKAICDYQDGYDGAWQDPNAIYNGGNT
jgi:hypothetical protein